MQASLMHKIDPPFCCQWWTQRTWNEISISPSCLKTWAWWYMIPALRTYQKEDRQQGQPSLHIETLPQNKQTNRQRKNRTWLYIFFMLLFTLGIICSQYKFLPIGWYVKEMGYIYTNIISKMHGPFHLWKHGWSWRPLGQHRKENSIWSPMSRI